MGMPKLVLSMDGLVLKEMALVKERTTIGRKPDNDIQIDNLAISGHHAVITCITNDAFLEDQNSTNGTYLNGQPVKKNVLRNNDVIELGKYRIKYLLDDAKPGLAPSEMIETAAYKAFEMPRATTETVLPPGAPAPSDTQILSAAARQAGVAAAAATAASAAGEGQGVIQVLSGANAGARAAAHQVAHHAGQAGAPGRGHHAPTPRLLHHPRRGRELPARQWQRDRRAGAPPCATTTSSRSRASRWSSSCVPEGAGRA